MKRNLSEPLIMGVLNVTPDSFSDGGRYNSMDKAISRIESMLNDGADIIDIGGESTRPGSDRISEQEELDRVMPILEKAKSLFDTAFSVDTYKYQVAKEALEIGADYLNDVSKLKDKRLAALSGEYKVPIILMHSIENPKTMQNNPRYSERGVFADVNSSLSEKAEEAKRCGAYEVIIDPGIGFGKLLEHNLELIKRIDELGGGNFRTLLGISRKSFISKAVGVTDTDDRDIETMAIHAYTHGKTDIIRVHNVAIHKRMTKMLKHLV